MGHYISDIGDRGRHVADITQQASQQHDYVAFVGIVASFGDYVSTQSNEVLGRVSFDQSYFGGSFYSTRSSSTSFPQASPHQTQPSRYAGPSGYAQPSGFSHPSSYAQPSSDGQPYEFAQPSPLRSTPPSASEYVPPSFSAWSSDTYASTFWCPSS